MSIKNNDDGTFSSTERNSQTYSNEKFVTRDAANSAEARAIYDKYNPAPGPTTNTDDGGSIFRVVFFVLGCWALLYYCMISPGLRAAFTLIYSGGFTSAVGFVLFYILKLFYFVLFLPHALWGAPLTWTPYIIQAVIITIASYLVWSRWAILKKKVILFLAVLFIFSYIPIGILWLNDSLWSSFSFFISPFGPLLG